MLDKLKQINELRKMQSEIKKQRIEATENGTRVVINGNMQIEDLHLNPELTTEQQEKAVKNAFNQAVNDLQKKMMSMFGGNLGL